MRVFVLTVCLTTACESWVPVHTVADAVATPKVRAVMPDETKVTLDHPTSDQVEDLLERAKRLEAMDVDPSTGWSPAITALTLVVIPAIAIFLGVSLSAALPH